MKLYVCINQQPLNGYKNLNLASDRIDFQHPDTICEQSSCTEIIVDGVLSYLNLQTVPQVLQIFMSRLRKGGKIIIRDYDIQEAIQKYNSGLLSIADLNLVLFGNGSPSKTSCISHTHLHDIITNSGLQIVSIELLDLTFSLIAQRV